MIPKKLEYFIENLDATSAEEIVKWLTDPNVSALNEMFFLAKKTAIIKNLRQA